METTTVHEPDEELLDAEAAIQDADRLHMLWRQSSQDEPAMQVRIPLWVLLAALDDLEPAALHLIKQRIEQRLAAIPAP